MSIQISKHLHAGADYLSDQKNMLMVLQVAPLVAKGCLSVLGKDYSQYSWIGRAGVLLPSLSLLGDVSGFINLFNFLKSPFKKELDAYEKFYYAKDGEENKVIRELREGGVCFPTEKQGWWAVARAVANLSGALSCFMAAYETLGGAALEHSPSAGMKAAGSFAGALSIGLNMWETHLKVSEDEFSGVYFSDRDVKEEKDREAHRELFKTNSQLELVGSTAVFFLKIAGGLAALHQVANVPESLKNVTQFASAYREKIIGGLFTFYVGWKGVQHVWVGFDKKKLEKDVTDSTQHWVRIGGVIARKMGDYGFKPLGIAFDIVGENADSLEKTFYPAGAFKELIKLSENIADCSMPGLKKTVGIGLKLIGKTAGTVGFLAMLHLYFDPKSKTAGWTKNVCSALSAIIDGKTAVSEFVAALNESKEGADERWGKLKKSSISILINVVSGFANISSYIEKVIPDPLSTVPGPNMPQATYDFCKVVGSIAGIAKDQITASAA